MIFVRFLAPTSDEPHKFSVDGRLLVGFTMAKLERMRLR